MREVRSNILTRWPVLQEHPVTAKDLDVHGSICDAAVARWAVAARSEYLGRCSALRKVQERSGLELQSRAINVPLGTALGRPTTVIVTASVTEVRPRSFVISVRIRPTGGNSRDTIDAASVIRLVDPASGQVHHIGEDVRDDLVALERSAEHYN
jgi:acyl-CoA thioesterase FadM